MKKFFYFLLIPAMTLGVRAQGPRVTTRPEPPDAIVLKAARGLPFIAMREGRSYQSAELSLENSGDSTTVTVKVKGAPDLTLGLSHGSRQIEIFVPEVKKAGVVGFVLENGGKTVATGKVDLAPVRKMTVYILPHSHNDLGYTEIQTNVERKQMNNLLLGMAYARQTKDYPAGARFVWNLEGVYAADLFLHRMNDQQRQEFIAAVKDGGVALNGMYVNTLTGLCRPEELLQLFRHSNEIAAQCGVKVESAMISDVPGYTWGTVAAMAQAGIKYFSVAPNYFDRIGTIFRDCENKPFYWVAPDGKEKILTWIPYRGYAMSHIYQRMSMKLVSDFLDEMDRIDYPYDITYVRWAGHHD